MPDTTSRLAQPTVALRCLAFLLLVITLLYCRTELQAQHLTTKPGASDRIQTVEFQGDRWRKCFPTETVHDIVFLGRDSLISVSVGETNHVINYYTGERLHAMQRGHFSRNALRSNQRYVLKAEPSLERWASVYAHFEYLIRYDLNNAARIDTFAFDINEHAYAGHTHAFLDAHPIPGSEHKSIIRITTNYMLDRTSGTTGYALLFDSRDTIPHNPGVEIGENAELRVSRDGKYCITGGRSSYYDRVTRWTDHYYIWRITGDGLVLEQELNRFDRIQLTPSTNEFLLYTDGAFAQRFVLDNSSEIWHNQDAFFLNEPGQFNKVSDTFFSMNSRSSTVDQIDVAVGTLLESCDVGEGGVAIRKMLLTPKEDMVLVISGNNTVAALNICGVDGPDYLREEDSSDLPQFQPGALGRNSASGNSEFSLQLGTHTLRMAASPQHSSHVRIVNLMGRIMINKHFEAGTPILINTGHWPAGTYFLARLSNGTDQQSSFVLSR